jgi:hypothetical protein
MNPDQIVNAENDPRYREEPEVDTKPEVARDRLVVPSDLEAETRRQVERLTKAQQTVQKQIAVSVSPGGKLRKNGPCLCGSGRKFKRCCMLKIKDGFLPPANLSGRPAPFTKQVPPTRKLRKQWEDQQKEADTTTTET